MKKFFTLENKSFKDLKVTTHKELWKKVKSEGYAGLAVDVKTVFTKEDGKNLFHFVFSSATQDRHGDVVEQNWDLKNFKDNPVFLDSHNYDSIEHIIGKVVKIGVKDGKLQGDVEFMLDNPKGLLAYKMAKGGFLNTTSVGFIPLKFSEDGKIMKSELLEQSAVSVPAQPDAHIENAVDKVEDKVEEKIVNEDIVKPTQIERKETSIIKQIAKQVELSDSNKQRLIKNIADELEKINPTNIAERKRKIYQSLRVIISKDKS